MQNSDLTSDEPPCMTWWKKLSESAQAYWLQIAKSCMTDHPSVTDAWAVAQRVAARAIYAPQ